VLDALRNDEELAFGELDVAESQFGQALARSSPGVSQAAVWYDLCLTRYAAGVGSVTVDGRLHQNAPYNLLLTPHWMLVVPRSSEDVAGIAVNSLGFAGSFFVKNEEQLAVLRRIGPMTVLRRVGLPRRGT